MVDYEYDYVGINLTITVIFIGWTCLAICVIQIVSIVLLLRDVRSLATRISENIDDDQVQEFSRLLLYVALVSYLTYVVVDSVGCILLIRGAHTDCHYLILPWLFQNLLTVCFKIAVMLFVVSLRLISNKIPVGSIAEFVWNLLLAGIHIWMWIVVLKLYLQVRDMKGSQCY